jgi:hypothetical protein
MTVLGSPLDADLYEYEMFFGFVISGLVYALFLPRYQSILAPITAHSITNIWLSLADRFESVRTDYWLHPGANIWTNIIGLLIVFSFIGFFLYEIVYKAIRNEIRTARTSGPSQVPALARRTS